MGRSLTLSKLKKKLQRIFNEYIRLRDDGKPCISCGEFKKLEAGHYFAVSGYDGLRFDEDNVHGECHYCNCFNESHLIGYGINLEYRIGSGRYSDLLERAEAYKKNIHRFSRSELEEMIEIYKEKVRILK